MAVTMTRREYEQKYGIRPITDTGDSQIDTAPAPTRMSRADFTVRYGYDPITKKPLDNRGVVGKALTPAKESFQYLKRLYGGGEEGIANRLKTDVSEAAKDIQKGEPKGIVKAGLRTAGDVAEAIFAPVSAALNSLGIGAATDAVGKWYVDKFGQGLTDNPTFQKFAMQHPNTGEDFNRALLLTMAAFDGSKIDPKTVVERTAEQYGGAVKVTKENIQRVKQTHSAVQKTADEIANIENNYSKLRNDNLYTKNNQASRERIARSGVLTDAVDETGTIRTRLPNGAVDRYRDLTIGGAEDVVRKNLVREGKIINLKDVSQALTDQVMNSGLEGNDLNRALSGITREIDGLMRRADANGDIPLYKIHDAKINTTKNIDFNTPPETKTYRKAIARGYKELVENTSDLPIEDVNKVLGKYLGDIKRLESLDGRKVKGGKLGKYSAQIAGNIAGGAIGGATGGLGGVAIGTIVGGEVASLLKGKSLARTFGEVKNPTVPKEPLLEQAKSPEGLKPKNESLSTTGKEASPQQQPEMQPKNPYEVKTTPAPQNVKKFLLQEARKSDSAEGLRERVVFRTETPPSEVAGQATLGKGRYFSRDNVFGGDTKAFILPDDLNIKVVNVPEGERAQRVLAELYPNTRVLGNFFPEELRKTLQDEGFDGLLIKGGRATDDGDQLVLYKGADRVKELPNIQTKSQITDIWKEAHNLKK